MKTVVRARKYGTILRTYPFAPKLMGYALQVTCDVDDVVCSRELFEEYVHHALKLSTVSPTFYVTAVSNDFFLQYKDALEKIDRKIVVGAHGARHVHYCAEDKTVAISDLERCAKLATHFRFPYLDVNMWLLKTVSNLFMVDSSIAKTGLHPYRIGRMWEYPVTQPSDNGFGDARVAARNYHDKIVRAQKREQHVTLLLHMNRFSVEIMKELEAIL